MNYYPHHIGDFDRATRHLTRIERSIYRDLIELYYDTEQPLSLDFEALCRKVIARTDEERTAVQQVLNEFFTRDEHGWRQERCEIEISAYRENVTKKSKAGKASAAKRAEKTGKKPSRRTTPVEHPQDHPLNGCATNQEPRTINQEPFNSDAGASGAGAAGPIPLTPKQELWATGKRLLGQAGMTELASGKFIGKLAKDYGELIVLDAIRSADFAQPASPVDYIKATCMRNSGQRQPINKQEALEARNRAVGDDWLREQEALDGQR